MRKPETIKAQGTAFNLLRSYAQLEAMPVEVEAIALGEGMDFVVGPLTGCEARLVRDSTGNGFARISDRIKEPTRVRFALAHELGHFKMHVGESQTKACTRGDLVDYRKNPLEVEANIFASEILMPKRRFAEMAAKTGPSFDEIGELAQNFNVSLTAAIIRYIDIGPIEEMTLVVMGPNERVGWSKSRYGNWDFWVEEGMKVHDQSMAKCAFLAQDSVDATDVHPSVWFQKNYGFAVTEECHYMPEYRSVISLLVIERE